MGRYPPISSCSSISLYSLLSICIYYCLSRHRRCCFKQRLNIISKGMGETHSQQNVQNAQNQQKQQQPSLQFQQTPMKRMMMDSRNQSPPSIADSIIKYSLHKRNDSNLSRTVESTLNNLPVISASLPLAQLEQYDQFLKAKFVGEIEDNKYVGFGKLYFDNGDYLEGTFVGGRCQGQGRIVKADGSYYEGEIRGNQADGHGRYHDASGYKYEGQWKNNMPNGTGEASYTDGSRYVGDFLNGKRHGKGMHMGDQGIFEGDFRNGKIDGQCIYQGKACQRYVGNWQKGLKDGKGVYEWPDGKKYQGNYKNDKRNGFGVMSYFNGAQKYSGQWKNGLKHGKGMYESPTQKMNGEWTEGKLTRII